MSVSQFEMFCTNFFFEMFFTKFLICTKEGKAMSVDLFEIFCTKFTACYTRMSLQ